MLAIPSFDWYNRTIEGKGIKTMNCDLCNQPGGIERFSNGVPVCKVCPLCAGDEIPVKAKKVWTENEIVNLLRTNNRAVEKAIVAIYNRQTADEKASHDTKHSNSVGFSGADARFGTYLAKWILKGNHLTGKFLADGRELAVKYRKQLLDEATKGKK